MLIATGDTGAGTDQLNFDEDIGDLIAYGAGILILTVYNAMDRIEDYDIYK